MGLGGSHLGSWGSPGVMGVKGSWGLWGSSGVKGHMGSPGVVGLQGVVGRWWGSQGPYEGPQLAGSLIAAPPRRCSQTWRFWPPSSLPPSTTSITPGSPTSSSSAPVSAACKACRVQSAPCAKRAVCKASCVQSELCAKCAVRSAPPALRLHASPSPPAHAHPLHAPCRQLLLCVLCTPVSHAPPCTLLAHFPSHTSCTPPTPSSTPPSHTTRTSQPLHTRPLHAHPPLSRSPRTLAVPLRLGAGPALRPAVGVGAAPRRRRFPAASRRRLRHLPEPQQRAAPPPPRHRHRCGAECSAP